MSLNPATQDLFWQDSGKAGYVAVPRGSSVTVRNNGNTLYYKSTSDVTSSSNDGNIASGSSATFTSGQFVITAQGVMTQVFASRDDAFDSNLRVGGNETVVGNETVSGTSTATGSSTVTGGVVQTSATAFPGFVNIPVVSATGGTDTAFADGTLFVTSIFIPANATITNISYLVGSVGGTDKVVARLYNSAGTSVANTTTTASGTTAGTAAQIQTIALTSTYAATGPGLYYVGIQANGATAKLRTVPAQLTSGIYAGSVALTHAASTAITPPTTFTADKAPYVFLS